MQGLVMFLVHIVLSSTVAVDFHKDPNRDQGFAEKVYLDVKFECSNFNKRLYSVPSEIQCHQRCLRSNQCALINFRHGEGDNQDNCELFGASEDSCRSVEGMNGWKAIVFKRVNITVQIPVYKDCKDAHSKNMASVSGVYNLYSGKHYCVMESLLGCGDGGWTLALKMNGTKNTFVYSSPLWTNNQTYNTDTGLHSFTSEEAKFPAFSTMSFEKLCLGMNVNNSTIWQRILLNETSLSNDTTLMQIFQTGDYIMTNRGRSIWKSLIPDSSLQQNCNREGFNSKGDGNELQMRIGLIANQEDNCLTPESFIGYGSPKVSLCDPAVSPISCGNFAVCSADNGSKSVAAFGYLLLK